MRAETSLYWSLPVVMRRLILGPKKWLLSLVDSVWTLSSQTKGLISGNIVDVDENSSLSEDNLKNQNSRLSGYVLEIWRNREAKIGKNSRNWK